MARRFTPGSQREHPAELAELLGRVARGDQRAFERVYEHVSGPVYGLVLRIVRDPAQAEEVAQEALVELWRKASRYEPARGSAMAWAMTLAHRRAVDRVRSAQAAGDREARALGTGPAYDEVAEQVQTRLEREQVRQCLETLTEVQRESVTLAAAYALDAVSDTEGRRFERHLTGCPTCAQEVRELQETAARLAVAAAQPPPATLRERVLTRTARARRLPPRLRERRPGPKARGMNWILAAACLVLALIAGVTAVGPQHRAQRAEALNQQITTIMAAPDAHTVVGQARPAGTATILMSRSLGKAVIVASGLRTLSAAKTYQLWFMGAGPPRPAGILRLSAGRPSRLVLAGPVGGARQIGLTIEPAGGSPQPTSPPILTAPLS